MRWALLVLSIGVLAALAGSFVPYEAVLAHGHPWLPQRQCPGCALCGMTRSFCAMSAGRFDEAIDWNPLGPALYLIFWLWAGGFLLIAGHAISHFIRSWEKHHVSGENYA